jgi:hypothetical protein
LAYGWDVTIHVPQIALAWYLSEDAGYSVDSHMTIVPYN